MFLIKIISITFSTALLILAACSPHPTGTIVLPSPAPTTIQVLPTPSSLGDTVIWRHLQISMAQAEITDSFINEFGSQRLPPTGKKFLWVQVVLENVGNDEIPLPEPENFSVLYAESEFKPIYGHRQGYTDYTTLNSTLFPNQKLDAWLRFDIPATAELKDLWFVFLPTSAQVGVLPSSPTYPYTQDKPTYVWRTLRP